MSISSSIRRSGSYEFIEDSISLEKLKLYRSWRFGDGEYEVRDTLYVGDLKVFEILKSGSGVGHLKYINSKTIDKISVQLRDLHLKLKEEGRKI